MSKLKITLKRRDSSLVSLPWWYMSVTDVASDTTQEFHLGDKVRIGKRYANVPYFVIEAFLDADSPSCAGNATVVLSIPGHDGHKVRVTPDQIRPLSPLERLAGEAPEVIR